MKTRMLEKYDAEVKMQLKDELQYKNVMQVPQFKKICVSMCIKEAPSDNKAMERAMKDLGAITGQKPKMTRSKKAIAGFKLRENVPLGCVTTLRGQRMYEFFDRLVTIALPRVRDFQGISFKSFDGKGNFSLGIKEQIIFPEIDYDKVDKLRGMNITIVTDSGDDKASKRLLEMMGFPFRKKTA